MKKRIILGLSILGLFGLASCDEPNTNELDNNDNETTETEQETTDKIVVESNNYNKVNTTVYMVGDSTMCNYSPLDKYYYPRYGYGTQMDKYFDSEKVTFTNLAMSGRSSKSFMSESNYSTLQSSIKSGDYLIIGWGHNDEKYGTATYTGASYSSIDAALSDTTSFQYHLYEKYVKLAQAKGANPILVSPIVRLSSTNDYSGSTAHITQYGDYRKAVEDVATKYSIPFVDLTTITKNAYTELGYDEAKKFHAIFSGTDESSGADPNWGAIDTTHINFYGANFVAYQFAKNLQSTSSNLKYYAVNGKEKPTDSVLQKDSGYIWTKYESPNLSSYTPGENFATTTSGWYGTAFGNLSGNSTSNFFAKETSTGVFEVGSTGDKGKMASTGDGFAFLFKQVAANQNFKVSAKVTVLTSPKDNTQSAFGLMLRDDCYINITLQNTTLASTFGACGYYKDKAFFSRYNGSLSTTGNATALSTVTPNTIYYLTLEQNGQNLICTVKIGDQAEMTKTFTDYSLNAVDKDYMYVGFMATRNASIKVENIVFEDKGTNTGA
ncbi:MAG: hypothetical protein K6E20_07070 [Acholeplasmatales bacterium]|nr:hypothetical protein [Acholeplasmatales bacterium]